MTPTKQGLLEKEMATHCSSFSWRTSMDSMTRQKDNDTGRWGPQVRRCPMCYWEKWRAITNSSRKNNAAGPKQKRCWAADLSGGEGEVQCWKEQYCIGTCGVGEDSWESLGARWNQSILNEINPEYSLEGLMLSSLAGRFFSSVLLHRNCPALEKRRADNSHHSHEECPSRGGCPDGGKDLRSRNRPFRWPWGEGVRRLSPLLSSPFTPFPPGLVGWTQLVGESLYIEQNMVWRGKCKTVANR